MGDINDYLDKKVLVVEDSPSMKEALLKILNTIGFKNITTTNNGKEAYDELCLKARLDDPYEVIFSDINMPIMNGLTLLRHTRELNMYSKTPFFIVSTENEKDTVMQAILGGATDYILKPYSPNLVLDKLKKKLV
jgi:two-component system chemotaxis response regulator CheY